MIRLCQVEIGHLGLATFLSGKTLPRVGDYILRRCEFFSSKEELREFFVCRRIEHMAGGFGLQGLFLTA